MNTFNRELIAEFTSSANIQALAAALINHYNNPQVYRLVMDNINDMVYHFAVNVERELSVSDPILGSTIYDQLGCLNSQFLQDRVDFINAGNEPVAPVYAVSDLAGPASRYSRADLARPAGSILSAWSMNSGRGSQSREDPAGETSAGPNPFLFNSRMDAALSPDGGIVFCDQRKLGTSHLIDEIYEQPMFKRLNSGKVWSGQFGDGSVGENARLLARRTFRANEAGVENGIPRYESRLYKRNFDRNIDEGLRNQERDYKQYSNDRRSLFDRVDRRQAYYHAHDHGFATHNRMLY